MGSTTGCASCGPGCAVGSCDCAAAVPAQRLSEPPTPALKGIEREIRTLRARRRAWAEQVCAPLAMPSPDRGVVHRIERKLTIGGHSTDDGPPTHESLERELRAHRAQRRAWTEQAVAQADPRRLRADGSKQFPRAYATDDDIQRLIALFDVFRAHGLAPYPDDGTLTEESAAEALLLCGSNGLAKTGSARTLTEFTPVTVNFEPSYTDVAPPVPERCAKLGVAEATCGTLRADDAATNASRGCFTQVLRDLADMGAGFTRRVKKCDIYWGSLFPVGGDHSPMNSFQDGEEVPPPGEILTRMRADDHAVLADATSFLIGCKLSGVKVALTPFNSGGGASLTYSEADVDADPDTKINGVLVSTLIAGRPDHLDGVVTVVSSSGWNTWYVDHGRGVTAGDGYAFQKYCLYVGPAWDYDGSTIELYHQECARRKSLGVAAFATGIGEWLARVDAALREWDASLGNTGDGVLDIVDYIELGNEIDAAHWKDTADYERYRRSIVAGGRYMALLAAPISDRVPGLRYRASELLSPKPDPDERPDDCHPHRSPPYTAEDCCYGDTFDTQMGWLYDALNAGMFTTLSEWAELQYTESGYMPVMSASALQGYRDTCTDGGFAWPPVAASSIDLGTWSLTSLRHQAGFHWYRGDDHLATKGAAPVENVSLYADEVKLAAYVARFKAKFGPLGLSVSIGELGVASEYPSDDNATKNGADTYLANTDTRVQAAKLVKALATALAAGVDRVAWFCHFLGMVEEEAAHEPREGWQSNFSTMGLRNDTYLDGSFAKRTWTEQWSWRKPAWYAFQRLAWLLSLVKDDQPLLVVSANGMTLLRFHFRHAPQTNPAGEDLDRRFRYAWIGWVDPYAGSRCQYPDGSGVALASANLKLQLGSLAENPRADETFAFLSLVPEVTGSGGIGALDTAGFRAADSVNWYWPGWDDAAASSTYGTSPAPGSIGVELLPGTLELTRFRPAPICILCNLDAGSLG